MPLYPAAIQYNTFTQSIKADLPVHYIAQGNDTVHFSGEHAKSSATKTEGSSSGVVARGRQSRLFTAANDVRKDGFLQALNTATDNPNEYVKGDTTTLQVLLDNHACSAQAGMTEAATTREMLGAFLNHPKTKLLKQDTQVLAALITKVIHLNEPEILNAFTRVQGFDIKKLDEGLQVQIWAALRLM